ncbi:Vitamin B12 import ATP-binding protein BtuD [Streptomyces tendae]
MRAGTGDHSGLNNRRSNVNRLTAENVTLAYDQRVIAEKLSVAIPDNSFTVIVGPNACGKSTLLRALSRMLKPSEGRVLLDGSVIQSMPAKQVARTLGLLPQSSIAPDGITVGDLVGRGRYPHQGILRQWSAEDERVVQESMAQTGIAELADRYVDELSGGQRQRVWIAMALAQQTPLLLLDEPTTYLDIQHQIDVLDLCAELHEEQGRTLVAVLHDLVRGGAERLGSAGTRGTQCAAAGRAVRGRQKAWELGLGVKGVTASPLPGPSGNVEYFLWLRAGAGALDPADVDRAVAEGPR